MSMWTYYTLHILHPSAQTSSQFLCHRAGLAGPNSLSLCLALCPLLSMWCKLAILAHTAARINGLSAGSIDTAILDWRKQAEESTFCPEVLISSIFYQKRPSLGGFYGACKSLSKLVVCSPFHYCSVYMTWPRTHGAAGMSGSIYSHPKG